MLRFGPPYNTATAAPVTALIEEVTLELPRRTGRGARRHRHQALQNR